MSKRILRLLGLLALIVICAPARVPAWAQFSTPYDPDFPPEATQPAPKKTPAVQLQPGESPSAQPAPVPPEAGPTEETPGPAIRLPAAAGRFLLMDRDDPDHIFEVPVALSTEPAKQHDFLEFEQKLRPFEYSQEKWNRFREEDFVVIETTTNYIMPWGMGISTAPAKPPPPEIELPTYGTSLSVTGRKVIGVSYSEKKFLNPQILSGRPQSTGLFDITQQLQLRMQGKVGPKITVNVDYDDTKTNHQDISVVYTGDPDEVVQNVSFGDIDLTLPPTEFVSYNKQLFGIRADIKYKGLKATFIGSRTKGITKSKEFTGNQQFVAEDISDVAYLRRQYYDLSFGDTSRMPIKTGSEHVFLSQNAVTQANTNTASLNVNDLAVPSSTFTGTFQQLNAGIDYTIDYVHGFIHLTNPLQPQFVLAIDFVDASGNALSVEQSSFSTTAGAPTCVEPALTGFGLPSVPQGHACPIIIKTSADIPISSATETGYNRELKTFYNLGQTSIIPDNGRGNFLLQVLDQNRNLVGPGLNPPEQYPQTMIVDFANGIFQLQQPFAVVGDSAIADPNIYAVTPIQQRIIHAEFSYAFKTFILEPNLVAQSEIVLLNNQKLNRNVDYFIDYDAGFLTFFNPGRLTAQSVIDISYEVSPFAGITNTSLLGSRISYDFNKHYSVGATVLYQAGVKSPTTPTITELAQSNLVYDMDQKVTDISLGKKFKIKAAAVEIAQSRTDLNLNPFAIIDNMEGVRVEDDASILFTAWQIASNPSGTPSFASDLSWSNVNIPVLTINPRAQANNNQTQQVLSLNYSNFQSAPGGTSNPDAGGAGEEVSIVFPFSVSGLDFSQRSILEVVMQGDNSKNLINFHLGGINEDADGTGGLTLNCASGQIINNAPKTEDLQCTGILAPGEDIGWCYAGNLVGGVCTAAVGPAASCYDVPTFHATCPPLAVGAGNGKIDTEDLNGNGRLDPQDATGSDYGFMGPTAAQTSNGVDQTLLYDATNASTHTVIDFGTNANDWRTFQIPLNITSATIANWTNIKQIRITIKSAAGGATSGGVNFARIAVVGNTWSPGAATDPATASSPVGSETMVVTPVNNVNNPNYSPIFNGNADSIGVYNDLYGSVGAQQQLSNTSNISEQALQLSFTNMTVCDAGCSGGGAPQSSIVVTKRIFSKAIDISQHRFFNFLLYGNAAPPVDTAGIGSTKPQHTFFLRVGDDSDFWEVDVPLNFQGWKKIFVTQLDSAHNSVADTWQVGYPGTVVISSGVPNLQAVGEIVAGVRRNSVAPGTPDATPTAGTLWLDEIYLSQPLQRVGNAAAVSASFEIPGWATFGGKYRSVDRNFETPTSVISNQDNLSETGFLNYTRISYFPMAFNLSRTVTVTPQTSATGQLSNLVNLLQQGQVTTWIGSAQGNFSRGAFPRVNLNYTRTFIDYQLLTRTDDRNTYTATLQYGVPGNHHFLPKTLDLNYMWQRYEIDFNSLQAQQTPGNFSTVELTQTGGSRLTFVPWTGSSFNPSYSLTKVIEHRNDDTGPVTQQFTYPKSMHETASIASNYRLTSWLNPQVNYSADVLDSEILNVSTFVVGASTYVFNVGQVKNVNRTANGSISLPITVGDIFKRSKLFHSLNIVSGYQLQDGDVWYNVESQLDTQGALWVRQPLHPTSPAAQLQSQTLRDTFNSTQRWSPLGDYAIKGRLAAFKTLSISNNFVESIQRANATGTQSKTISVTVPDLVASISQLEKLWFTEGWMKNTQMNFRYSQHRINNVGTTLNTDYTFGTDLRSIILRRFDSLISANIRHANAEDLQTAANTQVTDHQDATVQTTFDIKKFRFTPKVTYTHDQSLLGTGVVTQNDTNITPSVLVRADLALPRGLLIPGTTKPILFSNRIIWTTTLSFQLETSPVTQLNNFNLGTLNTSMDYELAKNLRMTLNGAFSREWSKFLPEEDFISYSFGTTLTFQF